MKMKVFGDSHFANDSMVDWFMEIIFFRGMMIFLMLGVLIGVPYGLYAFITYKAPESFSLRYDEWKCTEQATWTHKVLVGKIITDRTEQICITYQWRQK